MQIEEGKYYRIISAGEKSLKIYQHKIVKVTKRYNMDKNIILEYRDIKNMSRICDVKSYYGRTLVVEELLLGELLYG